VITIPNGVNSAIFFQRDSVLCRRTLEIPATRRIILTAGQLIPLKGHHHLIQALPGVIDRLGDVELWIAGDGSRRDNNEAELRELVSRLGLAKHVKFLGLVKPDALAETMSAADVFCLLSRREGWPNVVHEALSCGTPVVATAVGAVPEMVPRPEYGIVIPAEQADHAGEALIRALETKWNREAIAEWGRARSWKQVACEVVVQVEEILQEVGRS
jgi:glycosyltransferase involved in cell wall biosynthesis